jgi:hypothetical protein
MSAVAVVLGRKARRRGGGGQVWLDEKGNAFGGILGVGVEGGKND